MMSNNKRARTVFVKKSSVVATEIALAMIAAQIAYAQQPPQQAAPAAQPARTAAAEQVERIEITGTRIPQVNVEGPSPVTTLNAQDIKFDGYAKAEKLRTPGDDDAILRWNSCVRLMERHPEVRAREPEPFEPSFE